MEVVAIGSLVVVIVVAASERGSLIAVITILGTSLRLRPTL